MAKECSNSSCDKSSCEGCASKGNSQPQNFQAEQNMTPPGLVVAGPNAAITVHTDIRRPRK